MAENQQQESESCVFCRRTGLPKSEMSDEHVFLKSLKHLATPGATSRIRFVYTDPQTGKRRDEATPYDHPYEVTVRICADCNTKVLNNRIEQPIRKRLRSMIAGEAVHLNSADMLNFARWCAKTAMTRELIDCQDGRGPHAIPSDQYALLHDRGLPPFTMMMYFGKAEYTPNKWHRHRRFYFTAPDAGVTGTGHFTTLVIGHLWIVIAGFSDYGLGQELWIDVEGLCTVGTMSVLQRFWPPHDHEVDVEADKIRLDSRNFPPGGKHGGPVQGTEPQYASLSFGPATWGQVKDALPPS